MHKAAKFCTTQRPSLYAAKSAVTSRVSIAGSKLFDVFPKNPDKIAL